MKALILLIAAVTLFVSTFRPAYASSRGKTIAQDALIGGAIGVVTGLIIGGVPACFLIGVISGGLFGYVDSEGGFSTLPVPRPSVALHSFESSSPVERYNLTNSSSRL